MIESDFAYSARRSQEEAVRAIGALSPVAASAHWRLSVMHSVRALQALRAAAV